MAPDIMKGLCPPPCDECKKKQIQKIMSTIARKYPKEWNEMVQQVGKWIINKKLSTDLFYSELLQFV